jgi:heat shock protein HtpX
MAGTLAIIIGLSTLFFTVILSLVGYFDIVTLGILVVAFNIFQWLISPYIIDALYSVREISEHENPKLHATIDSLSKKSGIRKPRVMVAHIPIPNAFAYGSPIAGSRVAITTGLLDALEYEEVEAGIGHELGHLKHRDVQIMMFVSILPAVLYYIGFSFMLSSMYGRRREGGGGSALLGIGFMIFSWILNIFILYLSRLREYYADRHSISIVEDGPRKLSEGLAKIVHKTKNVRRQGSRRNKTQHQNALKALFIADPDRAETDSANIVRAQGFVGDQRLVQEILSKEVSTMDRIIEIFSTHPNIVKRLTALRGNA